jgi:organic hydroperoxide reductase OsmC/OhrA
MTGRDGKHSYSVQIRWTGNLGKGTGSYTGYSRNHEITAPGKGVLDCSSDPSFRGDSARYNPEELLVASLSSCHMLWYLHLCAESGITIVDYDDAATGQMTETRDGGRFTEVILAPTVRISATSDAKVAESLHSRAHELCFIASSVNFPVLCRPTTLVETSDATFPHPRERYREGDPSQ